MDIKPIFNLAHLCSKKGIKHAVISPGSRNAALTIAFARHPEIECFSVPDERSAAFIALGLSLKTKKPTVLICTSGSAALNYAPAVAEAFFNEVPLLILTADRPPEWIDQKDGQTVYQEHIFGAHAKKSLLFPSLDTHQESEWHRQRMANEAINIANTAPYGPVHINIPFREPFYPSDITLNYDNADIKLISSGGIMEPSLSDHSTELKKFDKILIVIGQNPSNKALTHVLSLIGSNKNIPIVADVISNQQDVEEVIQHQDLFLKGYNQDDLAPDLLITVGLSVISKNLKLYLRKSKIKAHWHIGLHDEVADTFQSLTQIIVDSKLSALNSLLEDKETSDEQLTFYHRWQEINTSASNSIANYDAHAFSEFSCYQILFNQLPDHIDLHLANSMAVRYANILALKSKRGIEVYCNRGTSGIDGTNSTAIGTALASKRSTLLITGDVAFLYDRNAFWHNHVPEHLNIIVFNNHGGGIFRMIKGPADQSELEEFFETKQKKTAEFVARENGFQYLPCNNEIEFKTQLQLFNQSNANRKILEIFTTAKTNTEVYKGLFNNVL